VVEKEKSLWVNFISKWAFILPVPVVLLFTSIGILLSSVSDAPIELTFMIAASKDPLGLRLSGLAIISLWLSMGVYFIALANFFRREYPIRSTFLAVCGLGFMIPLSAGNHHWNAGLDLAKRYASATVEQKVMLEEIQKTYFYSVESIIDTANLFWVLGILLFISMGIVSKTIPTVVSSLYALSGTFMLLVFMSNIIGYTVPFFLIPVFWLITIAAHISLGLVFQKKRKLFLLSKQTGQ
jgi:hypothetical protein